MENVIMFVDGSCLNNARAKQGLSYGGYGCRIVYPFNQHEDFSGGIEGSKVTNNVGELMAFKAGVERCASLNIRDFIYVYSDSTYVINIFTKYIDNWIKLNWCKKGGKNIENLELIQSIYKIIKDADLYIIFKKCRASHDVPEPEDEYENMIWKGNDHVDKLAKICANDMKEKSLSVISISVNDEKKKAPVKKTMKKILKVRKVKN